MSRYRPPRPKSSPYITKTGYDCLQNELTHLWKVKRPEVTKKVSEAAAQGDRSENAEYIYGKKQLREIDGRIGFLSRRLDILQVIEQIPTDRCKVFFGAWVTLEDQHGETHKYRIVGADEIDPTLGYISIDAPLARSLIGKGIDDIVSISPPKQESAPRILEIGQAPKISEYSITNIEYK